MGGRVTMSDAEAWRILAATREVRVAGIVRDRPVLRTLHPAIHESALWFHASPDGETAELVGGRIVACAERIWARIPSWMRDAQRACPATTWYTSVQVEGVLEPVSDPAARAAALQAMMERLQPEGRHVPITADHPLYRGPVRGLAIARLVPDRISAVHKLGQERTDDEMRAVLAGLWQRGEEEDLAAIEVASRAHPSRPHFRATLPGFVPRCWPSPADVAAAVALLRDAYWNEGVSDAVIAASHRSSVAWVGLEHEGQLVATARAISDRVKRSWIYDVAVHPRFQRQGIGTALMELMLDHPAVRETSLFLTTRDAMPFYAGLRFVELWTEPPTDGRWARTHMMRQRVATQSQPPPLHAHAPGGGNGVTQAMSQVDSGISEPRTQVGAHGSEHES